MGKQRGRRSNTIALLRRRWSPRTPTEVQGNWNRLVVTLLLRDFVSRRKLRMFDEAMAAMANDPPSSLSVPRIAEQFAAAESDGLSDG